MPNGNRYNTATNPADPASMESLTAFYNQPNVQAFARALQQEVDREGGGAQAAVGAMLWASQHYQEYGLTEADIRQMVQVQESGYAYNPQTRHLEKQSLLERGAKFVLGYVMPAVAGALVGGEAIGALTGGGAGTPAAATSAIEEATPASWEIPFGATGPGIVAGPGAAALETAATSAPSWLSSSLLPVGIQAGAGLLGAALQARAAGKATEAQLKYLREALAYEKERDRYGYATEANRYAALMGETAPYRATGVASNARMADLLGLPGPPPAAPEAPPPTYPTPSLPGVTAPAGTAVPRGQPPGSVPMGPGGSVMMRAPDGSQQQVPREFVPHYVSRGATVMGGT